MKAEIKRERKKRGKRKREKMWILWTHYFMYEKKLFCQVVHQNSFSSIDKAVFFLAKGKKNLLASEVELYQFKQA